MIITLSILMVPLLKTMMIIPADVYAAVKSETMILPATLLCEMKDCLVPDDHNNENGPVIIIDHDGNYYHGNNLLPARLLLTTKETELPAPRRVETTVERSTSRQSMLFTRRMQSFTFLKLE